MGEPFLASSPLTGEDSGEGEPLTSPTRRTLTQARDKATRCYFLALLFVTRRRGTLTGGQYSDTKYTRTNVGADYGGDL